MSRRLDSLPAAPLRLVFFGTPELAATILGRLLEGTDRVVGVFTRPDAPRGRGLERTSPPVKVLAERHGIPVRQPARWKDGSAVAELGDLAPDLVIVAAYGRLLPQAALDVPRHGAINVHASLLPRWRGADPITRAIAAGDAETGVTIMRMVLEMDAGDVLLQSALAIAADDTGESLETRLAELGADTLERALATWRRGELTSTPQDPLQVTFAPPIVKDEARIDWARPALEIERRTRAFTPWPGCSTALEGAPLKIWRAAVEDTPRQAAEAAPGSIIAIDPRGVLVATGGGALRLLEVQAAGKRRLPAAEFARGARLEPGQALGA